MNYRQYRALFQDFVIQPWNETKSFSISDDSRTLESHGAGIYPMLQLDTPEFSPQITRGSTGRKNFSGQVAILLPVENGDPAEEDRALEIAETEISKLIAWIDYKRKEGIGDITSISAFPIKRFETLNLFGWGISINIQSKVDFCLDGADIAATIATEYLTPIWTEGQTEISLDFDSNVYSAPWAAKAQLSRALSSLFDQINAESGTTGLIAERFLDSLYIQNPNSLAASASGHTVLNKSGDSITS